MGKTSMLKMISESSHSRLTESSHSRFYLSVQFSFVGPILVLYPQSLKGPDHRCLIVIDFGVVSMSLFTQWIYLFCICRRLTWSSYISGWMSVWRCCTRIREWPGQGAEAHPWIWHRLVWSHSCQGTVMPALVFQMKTVDSLIPPFLMF